MTIKYSEKKDLIKIAECYKSAFPDSLSSKMGVKYLTKMIEWYISDDKKFLFHLEVDKKCVGFCGGMIDDGSQLIGSASGMIQYSFNQAVLSFAKRPWLLFHKEFLSKYKLILKNVGRKWRNKKNRIQKISNTKKQKRESQTGLVVIGVSYEFQGKGYGSLLLQEFENKTKELNIKKMGLTVRIDNLQAIKSYEKNGWVKDLVKDKSLEMVKELN